MGDEQNKKNKPFSDGFAIKNIGIEHATVFITTMFNMIGAYTTNKIPFRAVVEYDPEQDCNTHVHIEGIKDEDTEKSDSIQE